MIGRLRHRAQIFVDDKLGREDFGAAVDTWIDRHAVTDSTKDGHRVTAGAWVKKTFQGRSFRPSGPGRPATDADQHETRANLFHCERRTRWGWPDRDSAGAARAFQVS